MSEYIENLQVNIEPVLDVKSLNVIISNLKQSLGKFGGDIKLIDEVKLKAQLSSLKKDVGGVADEAKKIGTGLGAVGNSLDSINRKARETQTLFTKAFNFNQVMQSVNTVTAAFDRFTQPYAEFDAQLRGIGTLGVKNFQDLRGGILSAAKDIPESISSVTNSIYDLVSAGGAPLKDGMIDVSQALGFINTASKGAVAGVTDTKSMVKTLTATLNAYGLSMDKVGEVSDTLFQTTVKGVTTIPELNAALANVVPTAAAFGVNFRQVGAAIASMTQKGEQTGVATTKLRSFLVELSKPGDVLANVMERAGVSLDSLKTDGLQVTIGKLSTAMGGLGLKATQVFGAVEAAGAVLQLGGDNLTGALATLESYATESVGAVDRAYEIQSNSIKFKIQSVVNSIEAFAFKAFEVVGDGVVTVISLGSQLAPVVSSFAGLSQLIPPGAFQNVKAYAASIGGALIPSLFVTDAATKSLRFNSEALSLSNLKLAASNIRTAITARAQAISTGVQSLATKAATASQWSLNAALLANPVGLIIAGIVALVGVMVLLYNKSETVRALFDGLWAGIKDVADGIINVSTAIFETLVPIGKIILTTWLLPFKLSFEFAKVLFEMVQNVAGAFFGLNDAGDKATKGGIAGFFDKIVTALEPVKQAFEELQARFAEAWAKIMTVLRPVMEFIIGTVIVYFKILFEVYKAIAKFIINVFVAYYTALWNVLKGIAEFIASAFIATWNALVSVLNNAVSTVKNFANENKILSSIMDVISAAFNAVKASIMSAWQGVAAFVAQIQKMGGVVNFVRATLGGLTSAFDVVNNALKQFIEGVFSLDIEKIKNAFLGIGDKVKQGFNEGFKGVQKDLEGEAADKIKQAAGNIADGVSDKMSGAADDISSAMSGLEMYNKLETDRFELNKKQIKDQTKLIDGKLKADLNAGKITQAQYKDAYDNMAKWAKEAQGAGSATAQKERADILATYKELVESNKQRLVEMKLVQDKDLALQGMARANREDLIVETQKLTYLNQQRDALTKLLETTKTMVDASGKLIFGAQISDEDKKTVTTEWQALAGEIMATETAVLRLDTGLNIEDAQIKDDLRKINAKIRDNKLEKLRIDYELNLLDPEQYYNQARAITRAQIGDIETEIDGLQKLMVRGVTATGQQATAVQIAEMEQRISELVNSMSNGFKELNDLERDAVNDIADYKARKVKDVAQLEYQLRVLEAKKQYDDDVANARGSEALKLRAFMAYQNEKLRAEQDFQTKSLSMTRKVAIDSISIFTQSMAAFTGDRQNDNAKTAQDALARLKEEESLNLESLRKREIGYAEYSRRKSDIDSQRVEQEQQVGNRLQLIADAFNERFIAAFTDLRNRSVEQIGLLTTEYQTQSDLYLQIERDKAALALEITRALVNGQLEEYQRLNEEYEMLTATQERVENDKASTLEAIQARVVGTFGSSLATMLAQGASFQKAFLTSALAALKALIPILVAEIIGKEFATKSLLGLATAGIMTAALYGLVGAAERSVAGFRDGIVHFRGKGTRTSDGNYVKISDEESVITAKGTLAKGNIPMLKHINAGKSWRTYKGLSDDAMVMVVEDAGAKAEINALGRKFDVLHNDMTEMKKVLETTKMVETNHAFYIEAKNMVTEKVKEVQLWRG